MTTSEPLDVISGQATDVPEGPKREREGRFFAVSLTLAATGLYVAVLTTILFTLPLKIQAIVGTEHQAGAFGLVAAIGAAVALVAYPLGGRFSDRTTSRLGCRRPWLLVAVIGCPVGLIAIATAGNLGQIIVGWVVVEMCANPAEAVLYATVADQVPVSRRGFVSGLFGIALPTSLVLGSLLVDAIGNELMRFLVPGLILVVSFLLFMVVLRDRRIARSSLRPFSWGEFGKSFVFNPRKNPDFGWVWVSRFAIMFGYSGVSTYLVYFLGDRFALSGSGLTSLLVVNSIALAVASIVASFVFGLVSDRVQRRRVFVFAGGMILTLGLATIAFAPSPTWVVIGGVLLGFGGGAYLAVDLALATEVLPNKADAAKDLGLLNTTGALPQSLAPAIAPSIIAAGAVVGFNGYALLYLFAALISLGGAVVIWRVRAVR